MGRRLSGNSGGAPRAKTVNRSVALVSGAVTTISRFGLLAPTSFVKTGGNANLTIAAGTGVVSAGGALAAGATQSLNGTATGADGVIVPFVANLTGMATITVAAAPVLALTGGSAQVSVAWTDGSNGGAPITAHKLYRAIASGAETLVGTITTASPYVDTGLTNGTAYFYKLSAVNSVGEGALSAEQGATPSDAAITAPGAPSLALTRGNAQLTLAWTDGATGGAAITAHKLYRGTAAGAETLVGTITTASPYVDSGLTNGIAYFYKLSAVNSVGEGALSAEQSAAPATVPGAPTLSVTAGNAQNTIGSTDGAANGSTITARRLYRATTSGFTPSAGNLIATNPTFPFADTGLTNGTAYYYKEVATNGVGDSAASAEVGGTPVSAGASGPYLASVTSAPYAVYGARRLVSGYAGNLLTLRRASDNAAQSFGCAAGSDLPDYAAINTWRGTADTYVTQIFDQKGSAAPLANATVAEQPRFETAQASAYGALGAPILVGAATSGVNHNLYADGFAFDRLNVSHVMLAELGGSATTIPLSWIADGSGTLVQGFHGSTNNGRFSLFEPPGGSTYPSVNAWAPTSPVAIGLASSATERRFFYRDTSEAVAASTSAAAVRYGIGKNSSVAAPQFRLWGTVIYPSLNTTDMNTAIAGVKAIINPPPFDRRVVLSGDSIALGYNYAYYQRNAPYYFKPLLTGSVEFLNRGIGGSTLAGLDSNYSSTTSSENIARFFTSAYGANKCMLIIERGINDLRTSSGTATTAYASLTSLVSKARSTGFTRIGVCTLMKDVNGLDTTNYPNLDTERINYNSMVRANTAGADFVIDFANAANVNDGSGAQADTTKFQDGLHPTDLGYSYLGSPYSAAVNAAW